MNAPSQRHHSPRSVETSFAQPVLTDRRVTHVAACVATWKDKPISPVRLHLRFSRHQADAENDGQQQNAHAYPPQNDACNRHPSSSD